jgi:cytochrome bd ubiquinol oxidase subunit II
LQRKAVAWARVRRGLTVLGMAAISIAIPLATLVLFARIARSLLALPQRFQQDQQRGIAVPFSGKLGIFFLSFKGQAYSLFPWLVIDRITTWQVATAVGSLEVVFFGVVLVLPVIVGYTVYSYRVFWGKSTALKY